MAQLNLSEKDIQWVLEKHYSHLQDVSMNVVLERLNNELQYAHAPISQRQAIKMLNDPKSDLNRDFAAILGQIHMIEHQNEQNIIFRNQQAERDQRFLQLQANKQISPAELEQMENELNQNKLLLNENEKLHRELQAQQKILNLSYQQLGKLMERRQLLMQNLKIQQEGQIEEVNTLMKNNGISPKLILTARKQEKLHDYYEALSQHLNPASSEFYDKYKQKFAEVITESSHRVSLNEIEKFSQSADPVTRAALKYSARFTEMKMEIKVSDQEINELKKQIQSIKEDMSTKAEKIQDNNAKLGKAFNISPKPVPGNSPQLEDKEMQQRQTFGLRGFGNNG